MSTNFLRTTFISLSENRRLRAYAEKSRAGLKVSSRFVAGTEVDDALNVAEALQRAGMSSSLDSLGESVTSKEKAREAAEVYHRLLDAIHSRGLNANVSLKLTQMGIDVDPGETQKILEELVKHAASVGGFVRVDMEGSGYTQRTIDMVRSVHASEGCRGRVGIVIQAYLYRSAADIATLVSDGVQIRLCKGAYREPPNLAFPKKSDVDQNYLDLAKEMIQSGVYHGIATHDERIIDGIKAFVKKSRIDVKSFEFQMLYGIRRDLQQALAKEGYGMRVYIPFGREWYPYFMRRLAERPANALFLARNLFKK